MYTLRIKYKEFSVGCHDCEKSFSTTEEHVSDCYLLLCEMIACQEIEDPIIATITRCDKGNPNVIQIIMLTDHARELILGTPKSLTTEQLNNLKKNNRDEPQN